MRQTTRFDHKKRRLRTLRRNQAYQYIVSVLTSVETHLMMGLKPLLGSQQSREAGVIHSEEKVFFIANGIQLVKSIVMVAF